MLSSYQELIVWQKAVKFSVAIYRITKTFPKEELYGLVSQIRRAAISIPSNIAEGYSRGSRREYIQFLKIAFSSGAEVETQLIISHQVAYLSQSHFDMLVDQLHEIQKMLQSLIKKLS